MGDKPQGFAKLTKDLIDHPETRDGAILILGALAAKHLKHYGAIGFFVNPAGMIEVAPLAELVLDSVSKDDAVKALWERGFDDAYVIGYLKGREARTKNLLEPVVQIPPPATGGDTLPTD